MKKKMTLMGASALVAAASLCAATATAAPVEVYGGGGSLVAFTLQQAANCLGNPVPLLINHAPSAPTTQSVTTFNYTGTKSPYTTGHNCASVAGGGAGPIDSNVTINYISSGSGAGGASFLSHSPSAYWNTATPGPTFTDVHFGESDAALAASDVSVYNNGGTDSTFKNVFIQDPGNTNGGTYPNPLIHNGAAVEMPLLVTPITFAYNPIYAATYDSSGNLVSTFKFHQKATPNADGSGGLRLDMTTACKIFNGQITMWSQIPTSLNGGASLADPTDTGGAVFNTLPIEIVGRFDSSGTTSIFSRALAAQCSSLISGNQFPDGSTTLPTAVRNTSGNGGQPGTTNPSTGNPFTVQPGKFSLVPNSLGVQQYIEFDPQSTGGPASTTVTSGGKMAYLSPDYAWPGMQFSGNNTDASGNAAHVDVVDIQRIVSGKALYLEPSVKNTLPGYTALPPQSDSLGNFVAGNTANGLRSDPNAWAYPQNIVLPNGNPNPIANPSNPKAYPVLGTTQAFLYTCYNDGAQAGLTSKMTAFVKYWYTNPIVTDTTFGILAKEGFANMPKAWITAFDNTFIKPITTIGATETDQLNLQILKTGAPVNVNHNEGQCIIGTGTFQGPGA